MQEKMADMIVLRAEAENILNHDPIENWHADLPKSTFLIEFDMMVPELAEFVFNIEFDFLKKKYGNKYGNKK